MIDQTEITPIDLETTSHRPRRRLVMLAGITTAVVALVAVELAAGVSGSTPVIPYPADPYNTPYFLSTFAPGHYHATMAVISDQCPGQAHTRNSYVPCTNLPTRTFDIDVAPGMNYLDLAFP
jgi:hypothetical protein